MFELRDVSKNLDPFPWVSGSIEDTTNILHAAASEFPLNSTDAGRLYWEVAGRGASGNVAEKFYQSDIKRMGPACRSLIEHMNSPDFVQKVSTTFQKKLIPDPSLKGAGLHMIGRGGFLKRHVDFNWHKPLRARRAVNLLLYLNDPWRENWGGDLILYEKTKHRFLESVVVPPHLGRLIMFETSDRSYHGHPEPLQCPEGIYRKSIALYYYEEGERPETVHSTIYE